MARTIWFSAYPFINKVFTPDDPRNYLRSIRSLPLPLQVKNRITLFPFSDILKPVHGYFFRGYFSDFFGLDLLHANTFSSFWTGPYENEKSCLVLGPTFSRKIESRFLPYVFENVLGPVLTCLVSETSHQDRWQQVSISRFKFDCRNVIKRPLNRDEFYRVLYNTLPRNDEWSCIFM